MAGALSYLEGLDENAGPDARSEAEQTVVENSREVERLKKQLSDLRSGAIAFFENEIELSLTAALLGEEGDLEAAEKFAKDYPELFNYRKYGSDVSFAGVNAAQKFSFLGDEVDLILSLTDKYLSPSQKAHALVQLSNYIDEARSEGEMVPDFYFKAHPEAVESMQWVRDIANEKQEAQRREIEEAQENAKQERYAYALSIMRKDASGQTLTQEEQGYLDAINRNANEASYANDPTYKAAEDEVYAIHWTDERFEVPELYENPNWNRQNAACWVQRAIMNYYRQDAALAQSAGMSLGELYEKHPELQRDMDTLFDRAVLDYQEMWSNPDAVKPFDFTAYVTGQSADTFEGNEGVGAGVAIGKGVENAGRGMYKGGLNFWEMYVTKDEVETVVFFNHANYVRKYGEVEGRKQFKADLEEAIRNIPDKDRRDAWTEALKNTNDVFNIPFDFDDEYIQNLSDEQNQAIANNIKYIAEHGTAAENVALSLTTTVASSAAGSAAAMAMTAAGVNPMLATAVAFGIGEAGESAKENYEATGDLNVARNVGAAKALVTTVLENASLPKWMKNGVAKNGAQVVSQGGVNAIKKVTGNIVKLAKEFGKNVAEEGLEEGLEAIGHDIVDAVIGGQTFDASQTADHAIKSFIMAALTSPLLSISGKIVDTAKLAIVGRGVEQRMTEVLGENAIKESYVEQTAAESFVKQVGDGALDAAALGETAAARAAAAAAQEASARAEEAKANLEVKRSQNAAHLSAVLENPTPETARAYTDSLTAMMEAGKMYTAADKASADANAAAQEAARRVDTVKQAAADALTQEARDMAWQEAGGSQGNSAWKPRSFLSAVGRKGFDLMNQMFLGVPAGYGTDGKGKPFAQGMDQTESMQPIRQDEAYDMASLLANSNFDEKPNWETMKSDHLTYSVEETKNGLIYYYSHGILEPGDIVPDPEGNPVVFEGWVPDSQAITFAGYGSGDMIKDIEGLVGRQGGTPERWEKQKQEGIVTRTHIDGEEETGYANFHWYYEPTIGIVERKIKEDDNKKIWFRPKIKMY